MKHTFQQNNITYSHFDNSFTDTVINKLGQGCYWRVDRVLNTFEPQKTP